MKKWLLIFLLLQIPIITALTSQSNNTKIDFIIKPSLTSQSNTSRIDAVINPTARSDTKGHLFTKIIEAIVEIFEGGGPRIPRMIVALYYDVLVDVEKDLYPVTENIIANITIINKGYIPDRDGILVSYLLDPNGIKFKEKKEEFELIPPTCPQGIFDWYTNLCRLGNETFEPKRITITRIVALPLNATLGEWKFYVTYQTRVQPLIEVYDSFEVYSARHYFWLIIGIIVFIAFSRRERRKPAGRKK